MSGKRTGLSAVRARNFEPWVFAKRMNLKTETRKENLFVIYKISFTSYQLLVIFAFLVSFL